MKPDMRWFFFGISGRIARLPYFLCIAFLNCVTAVVFWQGVPGIEAGTPSEAWSLVFTVYMLIAFWVYVVTTVKRLHDVNVTGWAALTLIVPIVGIVAVLALLVIPGTPGPNAYGDATNRPKT